MQDENTIPLKDMSVIKTTDITVKVEPEFDATSDSSVKRLTSDANSINKVYIPKQ